MEAGFTDFGNLTMSHCVDNGDESLGDDCDLSVSKDEKTPARRRKRPHEPGIRTATVRFLREKRKETNRLK